MEKLYTLTFNKNQLFDLHELLDLVLDNHVNAIDNPETEEEVLLGREIRLNFAQRTMNLFNDVDEQLKSIYREGEL